MHINNIKQQQVANGQITGTATKEFLWVLMSLPWNARTSSKKGLRHLGLGKVKGKVHV